MWPALELRTALTDGDISHLANLCHDCRDCFSSCMYTAPHEFDLNPPELFSQVRAKTYREYAYPPQAWVLGRWPSLLGGYLGLVIVLIVLGRVLGSDSQARAGSIYRLMPYSAILVVVLVPVAWSILAVTIGAARFWRDTHGPLRDLLGVRRWARTLVAGLTLRHMTGGGSGCDYPTDVPNGSRRRAHLILTAGFGLCLLSTAAAGIMQDFLDDRPPYAWLSVPVITGTAGGLGLIVGCTWLIALKRSADATLTTPTMTKADLGLLGALIALAATGLGTLVLRSTPAFEPVLVVHLAAVVLAFAVVPYSKFPHFVYRLLSIYQADLDRVPR